MSPKEDQGAAVVELCWDSGQLVELAPILDELVRITDDPNKLREYLLQRGKVAQQLGDKTGARSALSRVLDLDPVPSAVLLAHVLDFAGVIDAAAALRRFGCLQICGKLADFLFELSKRAKGIDLEHRHKAAVIVAAGRLDAKAEAGQETAQDLDHHR